MPEATIILNQNTSPGAGIAAWVDINSRQHQEVVIQTQNASADPVSIGSSNPLPISIAAGGVQASIDNTAFTAGSTPGIAFEGVYNDAVANLTVGNLGVPRLSIARQLLVANQACVNGGWLPYNLIGAASNNATLVKGSAGSIGSIICGNNAATIAYLKLFNKATAPVPGTDTPVHTIMIPANTAGSGFAYPIPAGLSFNLGIGLAVTLGIALNDNTPLVGGGTVCVSLGYL